MNFADRFNRAMEVRELSLTDIHLKTGISKQYLKKLASGSNSNPSLKVIRKLCGILDLQAEYFIANHLKLEQADKLLTQTNEVMLSRSLTEERELRETVQKLRDHIDNLSSRLNL